MLKVQKSQENSVIERFSVFLGFFGEIMSTSDPIFKIFQKFFFSSLCLGVAPTKKICASSSSRCRVSHTNIIVVKLLSLSHTNIIVNAVVSLSLHERHRQRHEVARSIGQFQRGERERQSAFSCCNASVTEDSTRVAEDKNELGLFRQQPRPPPPDIGGTTKEGSD